MSTAFSGSFPLGIYDGIGSYEVADSQPGWRFYEHVNLFELQDLGQVLEPSFIPGSIVPGLPGGVTNPPPYPTAEIPFPPVIDADGPEPGNGGIVIPVTGEGCGMYFIGTYFKQPSEKIKYVVDYTTWSGLAADEEISQVSTSVARTDGVAVGAGDLTISGTYIDPDADNQKAVFFASEGVSGREYQVTVVADTTYDQTIEREVMFVVEEL